VPMWSILHTTPTSLVVAVLAQRGKIIKIPSLALNIVKYNFFFQAFQLSNFDNNNNKV